MSFENENNRDPRARLVREKYFSLRPRPLERWLWSQGIPSSAERVFWLHWQEGMQRGDWCSEIPLRRVARECDLDVSTVTRAYQCLIKLGCLRRTDPGRDPSNPFQQATAVTEVRLPRELLLTLHQHPDRRSSSSAPTTSRPAEEGAGIPTTLPSTTPPNEPAEPATTPTDPYPGLKGRDRARAISQLTEPMSATERQHYQQALRLHQTRMPFDLDSKLSAGARQTVLQVLTLLASTPDATEAPPPLHAAPPAKPPRKLSVFELARLKRDLQTLTTTTTAPELLRQVVWSIEAEAGALRRFSPLHALNIALKKIREGTWTRPNRMPPNWTLQAARPRSPGPASVPETCCHA